MYITYTTSRVEKAMLRVLYVSLSWYNRFWGAYIYNSRIKMCASTRWYNRFWGAYVYNLRYFSADKKARYTYLTALDD